MTHTKKEHSISKRFIVHSLSLSLFLSLFLSLSPSLSFTHTHIHTYTHIHTHVHSQAEIALRSLRVPHGSLSNLLSESSSLQHLIGQQWQASGLTLTEFCTVYAELKHSQMHLSRELEQTSVYYSIFKLLSSGWVWLSSAYVCLRVCVCRTHTCT